MNVEYSTLILAGASHQYYYPDGSIGSRYSFKIGDQSLLESVNNTYSSTDTTLVLNEREKTDVPLKLMKSQIRVGETRGALITALLALNNEALGKPLFIVPGDSLIAKEKYERFVADSLDSGSDISLVVFESDKQNYSYVRHKENKVVEVCEKKVISSNATAGVFYFVSAKIFLECAEWAITNNLITNGNYYIAPCLNYAVIHNRKILLFKIAEMEYFRFSNYEEAVISRERFLRGSI